MTPTERARTTRRRRLAHLGVGGVLAAVAGSQAGALIAEAGHSAPAATEAAAVATIQDPLPPKPRPTLRTVTRSHVRTPKPRPTAPKPHRLVLPPSSEAWAREPFSIRVANCESGGGPNDRHTFYDGDPHLRDPNGHDGKWQFAPSTWWSVGGRGNAADATEAEQDYRAWLLWSRDGWGQWECAGMV